MNQIDHSIAEYYLYYSDRDQQFWLVSYHGKTLYKFWIFIGSVEDATRIINHNKHLIPEWRKAGMRIELELDCTDKMYIWKTDHFQEYRK
jgi:hypothetical protein